MDPKKLEKYVRNTQMDIGCFKPNSSNIKELRISRDYQILEIEFYGRGNGPTTKYRYYPVSPEIYNEMIKASSTGTFFSENIRSNKDIKTFKI